ncbi:Spectrin beta chain, non-erythrocytic 5 [Halocaridina rubra]|uniref:Spectrin beta chain, non-erythrocytic 5 n=1 Tax=Halocaridina rubra TaxID=373956 RepID=A0AAN9AH46_HALRR
MHAFLQTSQQKINKSSSSTSSSSSSSSSDSSDDEKDDKHKTKSENTGKKTCERLLSFEAPDAINDRLQSINASYRQLCETAQRHFVYLQESIKAYAFFVDCDDFEEWLKDKERLLKRERSDDIETDRQWHEKIVADLDQAGSRLVTIDKFVQEFAMRGHSQLEKIKIRKSQIYEKWAYINRLRQQKELELQAATSVEEFLRICSDVEEWMQMKLEKVGVGELQRDLKTVQSLQRSLDQLERELSPIEEKLGRVNLMAESVKISYPNDSKGVTIRQQELQNLWSNLNNKLKQRKTAVEQSVAFIIFLNNTESLQKWIDDLNLKMSSEVFAVDVTLTKLELDAHQDLGQELQSLHKEFNDHKKLGEKLIKKNSNGKEVNDKLKVLEADEEGVQRAWLERLSILQHSTDITIFKREVEYIKVFTSSYEALLNNRDLGVSIIE